MCQCKPSCVLVHRLCRLFLVPLLSGSKGSLLQLWLKRAPLGDPSSQETELCLSTVKKHSLSRLHSTTIAWSKCCLALFRRSVSIDGILASHLPSKGISERRIWTDLNRSSDISLYRRSTWTLECHLAYGLCFCKRSIYFKIQNNCWIIFDSVVATWEPFPLASPPTHS